MAFYSVFAVTPNSEAWIPDYVAAVNVLVPKHGGRYIARTTRHEQLEGDPSPAALRVIIEWPDREAAEAFLNDPAYAGPLQARLDGAHNMHFLIEGTDDMAG
jgi:uncharacterized protein (DUF1330 family)